MTESEKEQSLTRPRGPPIALLPKLPKYRGVNSGQICIDRTGSTGWSGVLLTWHLKKKLTSVNDIITAHQNNCQTPPTFSKTTPQMRGKPSGFFILGLMNCRLRRNSLLYSFLSSASMWFCSSEDIREAEN